jgi:hypothetical protein
MHVARSQPDAADAPDAPDSLDPLADAEPAGDAAETADRSEPDEEGDGRSAETEALWAEVRIDPVLIALPPDLAGYTLRAYRSLRDLTPTDTTDRPPEEPDLFAVRRTADPDEVDEEELLAEFERSGGTVDAEAEEPVEDDDDARAGPGAADDDVAAAEPDELDEEVPVFLSHKGRLLLFASPESLVDFIRSDAPHDLAQLDSWATLAGRVRPEDIAPAQDDTYELDLVVDNLRGTHDAWDLPLLISAGELARDLGYALQLKPVITALASGSPLDDLDEALRAASSGGVGGFMGRRRLRKIGTQQASLGWRTIIGKISAAVDWRE